MSADPAPIPKISVLLPVYNGAAYISECIASVLNQTLSDFELLITDDFSDDASREIIESFTDSRIRTVYKPQNSGLFLTLNELLLRSRAPILRFLCQDDVLDCDCLATEVAFFDLHTNVAMAYC